MDLDGVPRFPVEPDPMAKLMGIIKALQKEVGALQRGAPLRNASISGGEGLSVYDDDGVRRTVLRGADGALVILGPDGEAVARFGPLLSDPGTYGGEIWNPTTQTWLKLLKDGAIDWASIANLPETFAPDPHTHPGADITTAVANATTATEATHAGQADGSQYGWTNNVAGTAFYAVYVGNDGGYHFGRNVSSILYKENVRDVATDPEAVLNLRPVIYDRKPTFRYPQEADGTRLEGPPQRFEGAKDQFGLIAQEVYEHLPDLVTIFDGEIDGVRYELVGPALIPVIKMQAQKIAEQAREIAAIKAALETLGVTL